MRQSLHAAFAGLFLAAFPACASSSEPRDLPVAEIDCRTGLYGNQAGDMLGLTPQVSGGYRWRMLDGRTGGLTQSERGWRSTLGWTTEDDGYAAELGGCDANAISFGGSGAMDRYTRVPLTITDTSFERDGVTFAGRLIWPEGAERAPLVIHVHGSERTSAVRIGSTPYMLAAQGIASFVYDKRGTGRSGGAYTQDFYELAADARAALTHARSLAGGRTSQIGFLGGSQGGWVAPLAASDVEVDFVIVLFGMAVNALQEDRYEIEQNLARAGWGPAEQAKGAELSRAAGVIVASNFTEGFEDFDRLRAAYRDEPWYDDIDGEFTSEMLPHSAAELRSIGPSRDLGTSWRYEPLPVLRALHEPQFWMLAAEDGEAPPAETIARIRTLQAEGRPIDLAVYPNADHSMVLVDRAADGSTRLTGHVRDYYRQIAGWVLARDVSYARNAGAEVTQARR